MAQNRSSNEDVLKLLRQIEVRLVFSDDVLLVGDL